MQRVSTRKVSKLNKIQRKMMPKVVPDWTVTEPRDAINRKFKFNDFKQAFSFMSLCAGTIVEQNYYPEWSNKSNEVEVTLTNEEAGGISRPDVELAMEMDKHYKKVVNESYLINFNQHQMKQSILLQLFDYSKIFNSSKISNQLNFAWLTAQYFMFSLFLNCLQTLLVT